MSIPEKVAQDLKTAMAARDNTRVGALRLIRAELLKAEKEKGEPLDDDRAVAILQKMLKQRNESIEQFEKGGRPELAEAERGEAAVIAEYLPEPLPQSEIESIVEEVIGQTGAADPSQMGRVMGQVMGRLKATGRPFDGKAVNQLVRSRLKK
jgi:uncharacterized protein YqeY